MQKYIIIILIVSGFMTILTVPKIITYQAIEAPTHSLIAPVTQYILKGKMASGKEVYDGAIANNQYPIGTIVKINGIEYTLEDRMAKRFSERWDIWQQDEETAWIWGIRELPIEIIYIPNK